MAGDHVWAASIRQAPVALSIIDLAGHQLAGNEAYAALFGYSLEEMQALEVSQLTHPEDRGRTADYLARLTRGEIEEFTTEKRYVRKDGSEFPGRLRTSLVSDDDGRPTALVGVIEDLTERQAARAARAHAERKYERVLGAERELVCEWLDDGTIVYVNDAYRKFFGYGPEIVGHSLFELLPEDLHDEQRAFLADLRADATDRLVRRRYDDGRVVSWSDTVVRDAEGTLLSVVSVGRDVTERSRFEAELARHRDEALEVSRLRSELVATVSHELRNPLHGILALTELLATADLPAAEAAMAEAVHRQATAMRRTVGDLMDLGRLQAGAFDLVVGPTDLRHVVRDALEVVSSRAAPGVELTAEIDDDVPDRVRADGQRLGQVLTNLLGNALAAVTRGGVHLGVDIVGGAFGSDRLRLRVIDTGVGIAAGHLELIFEAFARVPGALPGTGAGLGLAVVRQLVALMGGEVRVMSVPGRGSTFSVELPLIVDGAPCGGALGNEARVACRPCRPGSADCARMTTAEAGAEGRDGDGDGIRRLGRPTHILVVEDDPVNQLVASRQLARLGATVHLAADGGAALDLVDQLGGHLDLVLMDLGLPDIDGREVTRQMRAKGGRRIPVVAMSASALPEDRAACVAAGMDDFVPKPAGLDQVRAAVLRWASDTPAASDRRGAADRPPPPPVEPLPSGRPTGVDPAALFDPASVDTAALVDPTALDSLVDELGDAATLVVRSFVELLPERLATLCRALDEGDGTGVRRIAHLLRPSAARFGALALAERCAVVDRPGGTLEPAVVNELVAQGRAAGAALAQWVATAPAQ